MGTNSQPGSTVTSYFSPLNTDPDSFVYLLPKTRNNPEVYFRGHDICFLKGAPEKVFRFCSTQLTIDDFENVTVQPFDDEYWLNAN